MSLFDSPGKRTDILTIYPDPAKAEGGMKRKKEGPGRHAAHERRDLTMKHAAFAVLTEAGAGPTQAAKVLGLSPATGTKLKKELNAYESQRQKLLSLSVKTVEKFVQGKAVGQTTDPLTGKKTGGVQPKGSDVMRAVELVMDREQPKVNLSANLNATFDPVNLADYYR